MTTVRHAYITVRGQDVRLTPARDHYRFPRWLKQVLKEEIAEEVDLLVRDSQGPDGGTWAHLTWECTAKPTNYDEHFTTA